jgi:hypothetical protein
MPHHAGLVSKKLRLHLDARRSHKPKLRGVVSGEGFLDAAESSADVVLVHAHVGGGKLERLGHLAGSTGKILR